MATIPAVAVTLSAPLLRHLRGRAAELEVPLAWLVAGLVCDAVEGLDEGPAAPPGPAPGARPHAGEGGRSGASGSVIRGGDGYAASRPQPPPTGTGALPRGGGPASYRRRPRTPSHRPVRIVAAWRAARPAGCNDGDPPARPGDVADPSPRALRPIGL